MWNSRYLRELKCLNNNLEMKITYKLVAMYQSPNR